MPQRELATQEDTAELFSDAVDLAEALLTIEELMADGDMDKLSDIVSDAQEWVNDMNLYINQTKLKSNKLNRVNGG